MTAIRLALTIVACIVAGLALAFALARVLTQEPMRSWGNGTAKIPDAGAAVAQLAQSALQQSGQMRVRVPSADIPTPGNSNGEHHGHQRQHPTVRASDGRESGWIRNSPLHFAFISSG